MTAHEGRLLAGRYRLTRPLGEGAQGAVWCAIDTATREEVAIKLLHASAAHDVARARREIAALRISRMPGVVPLLDDGIDQDELFVVTTLVGGSPFPGAAAPVAWAAIASTVERLLETLGRVHAAGILHRDVKPSNVLVADDGAPTLLDFGIARLQTAGWDKLTTESSVVGTPAYLAPEVLLGDAASESSDLYAVGVMLYEALTGAPPFESKSFSAALRARLTTQPRTLRELGVEVPLRVSGLVERLLDKTPERRPRSANEALEWLRAGDVSAPTRTWLGDRADLDLAVRNLLGAPRAVHFCGGRGAGKTRFAREVALVLRERGRSAIFLTPSGRALSAVDALIAEDSPSAEQPLSDVMAGVHKRLVALARAGGVLIVDDAHQLDRSTLALVESVAQTASSLFLWAEGRAPRGAFSLAPLARDALEPLFAGRDRVLHLREDAARLLHQRAGGTPLAIESELAAWCRAGLARETAAGYSVDRDSLDVLEAGLAAPIALPSASALTGVNQELLAWCQLARGHATARFVARASGAPLWQVEADLAELEECGAIGRDGADRIELRWPLDLSSTWPPERLARARVAVIDALPRGAEGRLSLCLATAQLPITTVVDEAVATAEALLRSGRTGLSMRVLEEASRMTRDADPRDPLAEVALLELRGKILETWAELACLDRAPGAIDRLLYELSRSRATEHTRALEALARAALDLAQDPLRALEALESIRRFGSVRLEGARAALRMVAARSAPLERERAILDEIARWAEVHDDADTRARLLACQGRFAYRTNDFSVAAALHAQAATLHTRPTDRIAQLLNSASACVEDFAFDLAIERASSAVAALREHRNALLELRAVWIERFARYRRGDDLDEDDELIEVAESLGMPALTAPILLLESAISWRRAPSNPGGAERMGGLSPPANPARARALALRAKQTWAGARLLGEFALLAQCLAFACGEPLDRAAVADCAEAASRCSTFGVGLQALALLAAGSPPDQRRELTTRATPLLDAVPQALHARRLDVLSTAEALALLKTP
ncbi:MAG: protein kinase [Polyangiaceae bacterium]